MRIKERSEEIGKGGGQWPRKRLHAVAPTVFKDGLCPRYGLEPEDLRHRCCRCSDNLNIDSSYVVDSQSMARVAGVMG